MSRYVDIEPYGNDRIVANKEDEGISCRDLPTADVAEVIHDYITRKAEAVIKKRMSFSVCSNCQRDIACCFQTVDGDFMGFAPYCPLCGAKMDRGERQ